MNHEGIEKLVSFYKEKIENIANKKLEFEIKPICEKSRDNYYTYMTFLAENINKKNKSEKSKIFEFEIKKQISKIIYPIFYFANYLNNFSKCGIYERDFLFENDTFYYSTYHEKDIDKTIVHEICHSLWFDLEKFNTKDEEGLEKEKVKWMEAFAYYGENIYFNFIKNIYTDNKFSIPKISNEFEDKFETIRKIVNKHGIESYLQIPMKWQEFEKEFNN